MKGHRYDCLRRAFVAAVLTLGLFGCSDQSSENASDSRTPSLDTTAADFAETLKAALDEPGSVPTVAATGPRINAATSDLYEQRGYQPLWLEANGRPSPRLDDLLAALVATERHGLLRDDYGHDALVAQSHWARSAKQVVLSSRAAALAQLEVLATTAWLAAVSDMADGRYAPEDLAARVETGIDIEHERIDLATAAQQAWTAGDLQEHLESLAPGHPQYRALQHLLADLVAEDNSDRPTLESNKLLSPGQSHADVVALRQLLNNRCEGCRKLPTTGPEAQRYDDTVKQAVATFQREQGPAADGLVGENTRKLLNLGPGDRIGLVRANLDRWRWYDAMDHERYIHVNIPEFKLRYHDGNARRPQLEMKIITGSPSHPTPLFSDNLEYLVLRPYWNVPASITNEELLPKLRENPFYLHEKNMEIVDEDQNTVSPWRIDWDQFAGSGLRLRQRPGPDNALGLIKFMMPNHHAVYLHDTNAPQLFDNSDRALSHGCIRLADPFALAQVLRPDKIWWSRSLLMRRGQVSEALPLKDKVPVYITYFTVVVEEGEARFLPDVYGMDEAAGQILADSGRSSFDATTEA